MTDPAPITPCDGGVLIRGAALPMMYRAVLALIARRSRDGLPSHDLQQLRTALYRAHATE